MLLSITRIHQSSRGRRKSTVEGSLKWRKSRNIDPMANNNLNTLEQLSGIWTGTNRLWMMPTDPALESPTTLTISTAAQDKFALWRYTWIYDGDPKEGLLLFSRRPQAGKVQAAWIDSWHMDTVMMVMEGTVDAGGRVSLLGHYAAPPGPDWGWRIELEAPSGTSVRLLMFNITPDGEAYPAVEAVYGRA